MTETVNNLPAEEEKESGFFSYKAIFSIVLLQWPWILVSVLIALGCAKLYLRYTKPVYTATMKVLIKDETGSGPRRSNQMALEQMGIVSNSQGFDNELEIIASSNIATRVVKAQKLYVSYTTEGRIATIELYKQSPILVDLEEGQLNSLKHPIRMTVTRKGNGIHVEGQVDGGESFSRDLSKLPTTVSTSVGTVMLQKNPGIAMTERPTFVTITPPEIVGRSYAARLTAAPTSKTTTVTRLTVMDTQMDRAVDFLSALVDCYNDDANEDKNEVAEKTKEFINDRIAAIQSDLDVTEGDLEQYKRENELINLANDATTALSSSAQYQKEQVEIQTQITLVQSLLTYLDNGSNNMQVIPSNLGLNDAALNAMISRYNESILQRNRLLKTSTEENPKVEALTIEIEGMRPAIRSSLMAILSDLKVQKQSIDGQYSLFTGKISNTPTQERVLNNIGRQQEVQAGLYLMLLQKREENYISLNSTATKARIIDRPVYGGKVSPKDLNVWGGALAVGLLLPIAIFLLLDFLRYRIEGRNDVEKLTKAPILADIPLHGRSKGKKNRNADKDQERAIVVHENNNDMMEEAFRGLRTNLRFVLGQDEKVILCTSCIPSEGKTFVATNLAMSIALLGKKVIIVGLDTRKPRLVKLFNMQAQKKGITTYLASDMGDLDLLEEQITHGVMSPNLDVIPAGIIPPNPGELISRDLLDKAIEYLRERYDYIILDTPPVGLVSDTLALSRLADMTLFVCRCDYSLKSNFALINDIRDNNKLPKVNMVVNGVDLKKRKYGYYYGYGKYGKYGYGKYGYGKYGHYGMYGQYGNAHKEHTEK